MKKKKISFVLVSMLFFIFNCQNNTIDPDELNVATLKADSISNLLNSPELKIINKELLENSNSAILYNKRALVYLKLKQLNEAVNDAKRSIKIDSTNANFYLSLVDIYFTQNNTRLAKELLEIIEKKFPQNTEALLKLSELYFLIQKYQKGIDYANKALKIDQNLSKGYYIKGSIYRESGDTNKAISSLETAIEQDNKFEDAFYDLGIIYAARKNPIALDYYSNVININPSNQFVFYARAKLLQDLGKIKEALAEYQKILLNNKTCENCYYNIGAIYLDVNNDFKNAIIYFTKAIEINPNYTEAYFARAFSHLKLNDKKSAVADFKMCLKIQPNYEPAIKELNNL